MDRDIMLAIQRGYALTIRSAVPGPRGVVAETYVIDTIDGRRLFVKIIRVPSFADQARVSLPVAAAMVRAGLRRIARPVPTVAGDWHLEVDGGVVAVFEHIDGVRTDDYDMRAYGRLLAEVHDVGARLAVPVPLEDFDFLAASGVAGQFASALVASGPLGDLLRRYEPAIRSYLDRIGAWADVLRDETYPAALTHGDAPGNVMVDAAGELYLIDWDEIRLGPAERDLWMTDHLRRFRDGYRDVRPWFEPDPRRRAYSVLRYYARCLRYYLVEAPDAAGMEADFLNGWMEPKLASAMAVALP